MTAPTVYNPGGVDTTAPHHRIKVTPTQAAEISNRIEVTAETPDLEDWGWLERTGRTTEYLCIVDDLHRHATDTYRREGRIGDLEVVWDIARDNAAWDTTYNGFARSMRLLLRKVREAYGLET